MLTSSLIGREVELHVGCIPLPRRSEKWLRQDLVKASPRGWVENRRQDVDGWSAEILINEECLDLL